MVHIRWLVFELFLIVSAHVSMDLNALYLGLIEGLCSHIRFLLHLLIKRGEGRNRRENSRGVESHFLRTHRLMGFWLQVYVVSFVPFERHVAHALVVNFVAVVEMRHVRRHLGDI